MIKTELLNSLKEKIKTGEIVTNEVPVAVALNSIKNQIKTMIAQGWSYDDLAEVYSRELQTEISVKDIRGTIGNKPQKMSKHPVKKASPAPAEPEHPDTAPPAPLNNKNETEQQEKELEEKKAPVEKKRSFFA